MLTKAHDQFRLSAIGRMVMKAFLLSLGLVLLFLATFFFYAQGVVVASFRGDQIVAVYAMQWGSFVLVALLIAAGVARSKHKPMRPWLLGYAGLASALLLATVISWHIIDDRECPARPATPGGCFNPQLQ